jgi:hypothetical protein
MQAIWIPASGFNNYLQAESLGIWGMNTKPQEQIGVGSRLLFAWDAGSPRIPVEEFTKKLPKNLVVAVATSPLYESNEILWPSPDGRLFPYRFGFEVIDVFAQDQAEEIRKRVGPLAMGAFHLSANKQSTPQSFVDEGAGQDKILYESVISQGAANSLAIVSIRKEQSKLRQVLIPENLGLCDLCGTEYASTFLVAAHIKPRSKCTDNEIWDIPRVAMAACLFGCDASFERGYVAVRNGFLWLSEGARSAPAVEAKFKPLVGRAIDKYKTSGDYFDWHYENKALR